jgi:hypothetical protein
LQAVREGGFVNDDPPVNWSQKVIPQGLLPSGPITVYNSQGSGSLSTVASLAIKSMSTLDSVLASPNINNDRHENTQKPPALFEADALTLPRKSEKTVNGKNNSKKLGKVASKTESVGSGKVNVPDFAEVCESRHAK